MSAEVKSGYKQTEVGVIPEEWEVTPLGSCLSVRPDYGINAPAVPYSDRFPVYIRITDITEDGRFLAANPVSVRSEAAGKYYLRDGDIVLARTGASVGKSYRYNLSDGPLVFAGFLIRIRPDTAKLVPAFAVAYLATGNYWRWVSSMSMRSGQPGINGKQFAELPMPKPHIEEQRAIATALSDVDELLGALARLIIKKRNLKQAAMQQLLTGQTRLAGEWIRKSGYRITEVGKIPEDWNTSTVIEVSNQIMDYRGRTPKKLGMDWGQGDIPALSAGNVKMGSIDFSVECYLGSESLYKRWMTRGHTAKDDIVFTTEAPLGNVALIPDERKYILSQRTVLLQIDPEKACSHFVYQLMLSEKFQRILMDFSSGSTAKGIKRKKFEQLLLTQPPLSEQHAIAAVLTDMDAELTALEQRRDKTRALKQSMMQELLTGKTRLI